MPISSLGKADGMVYGTFSSFVHTFSHYFQGKSAKLRQTLGGSSPELDPAEQPRIMNVDDFRKRGKEMVDYIADYMENIQKRRVVPAIEPGYLRHSLPTEAPKKAESYETVMQDFENFIMPGVTHWQHPRFHAYFPAGNSFPSILADMLSDALGCVGFSWAACPAMTELEMIMLDWFGRMIGLPEQFLPFTENGKGGGVIQGSASECNFVSLLAARFEVMKELRQRFPFVEEGLLMSKLIAYCSKEAHSSVEKACMIGMVKLRILETDSKFRLRGDTLRNAITEDRNMGLIPFFVSTTLGTTSCCSFDSLSEIGPICTDQELWLHVDAAYAGSAFICPEFRYLLSGIEHAMSFNTNPNKWLLVNFDCSTMWVKDRYKLTQALVVDPLYLQHSWTDKAIDYRHWGIPLSRRFRSLKLWFVIRMYGIDGLQNYIREHVRLAKKFEAQIKADDRFELIGDVIMGLVCFRLKGADDINQKLLTKLNSSGRIHMVPASLNERFVIRFCVCAENANDRDIVVAWEIIRQAAEHLLHENAAEPLVEEDELEEEEDVGKEKEVEEVAEQNEQPARRKTSEGAQPSSSEDLIAEKNKQTLAYKRSFFVRMVSDPKCYNPKIVRHLNLGSHRKMSEDLRRDMTLRHAIERGNTLNSRTRSSRLADSRNMDISSSADNDSTEEMTVALEQTGIQTPI
uniref:Aromatic-L-amino-acid decarboxylase n=1 Tax=Plectus sambesii TaxID=2011161 RepID=A0A914URP0_9BILA